jgi:NAD(P)-dependent dehydrogenase (short-subunit alcohol dehydrogenase family)
MAKIMLITGASRGIGAATARAAAAAGYSVAINFSRDAAAADAVVQALRAMSATAVAIQADVSRPEGAAQLFKAVDSQLGRIDVLVNNAGIIGRTATIDAMGEADLSAVFAANVYSCFYCSGEAIRRMGKSHGGAGGVIINLSSVAARTGGFPKEAAYAASKAAVDTFTLSLSKEVAPEGIRVVAVRPGLIETTMHEAHGGQETLTRLAPSVPLGRVGSPEEVAQTVLWLASPDASYIHGTLIDVSGGR